jgi:hypothetical protein
MRLVWPDSRRVPAAPLIDRRLRRAIGRIERSKPCIADAHRAVGELAWRIGAIRPSYEQVRVHLLAARVRRLARRNTVALVAEVHLRARPLTDLLALLEGHGPTPTTPRRR